MKTQVDPRTLRSKIAFATKATKANDAWLEAEEGQVVIRAGDGNTVGIRLDCPAVTEEAGVVGIGEAKDVMNLLKAFPAELLGVGVADGHATLSRSGSTYTLPVASEDECPGPCEEDWPVALRVEEGVLRMGLEHVLAAASRDETRPTICSVLFDQHGGCLRLVATDTYRLHMQDIECMEPPSPLVILERPLLHLFSTLGHGDAPVEIRANESHCAIRAGNVTMTIALEQYPYPNYRCVIPKPASPGVTCGVAALTAALRRLDVTTRMAEAFVDGKITVGTRFGELWLTDSSGGGMKGHEVIPAVVGREMKWCGNSRYLLEAIEHLPGEAQVTLQADGAICPLLVTCGDVPEYKAVVMPMEMV